MQAWLAAGHDGARPITKHRGDTHASRDLHRRSLLAALTPRCRRRAVIRDRARTGGAPALRACRRRGRHPILVRRRGREAHPEGHRGTRHRAGVPELAARRRPGDDRRRQVGRDLDRPPRIRVAGPPCQGHRRLQRALRLSRRRARACRDRPAHVRGAAGVQQEARRGRQHAHRRPPVPRRAPDDRQAGGLFAGRPPGQALPRRADPALDDDDPRLRRVSRRRSRSPSCRPL